ncbi:MAG TPA: divalent metal cation transporter, partial [Polyangiaceae bacterium]
VLGSAAASVLFAVGLLCSGQSATVTGTLAGQIVMEGFLQTRLSPVVRRVLTRCAAVVPALVVLATVGSRGMMPLLIGSQVVLSLQLPFAIVPLLRLANCPSLMGPYVTGRPMRYLTASCAIAVCSANALLLWKTFGDLGALGSSLAGAFACVCLAGFGFLVWVLVVPLRLTRSQEAQTTVRPPLLAS